MLVKRFAVSLFTNACALGRCIEDELLSLMIVTMRRVNVLITQINFIACMEKLSKSENQNVILKHLQIPVAHEIVDT